MSRFDATGRKPVDKWTAAPRLTTSPQANHNNRSGQLIWYINRSTHNVLDTPSAAGDSRRGASVTGTGTGHAIVFPRDSPGSCGVGWDKWDAAGPANGMGRSARRVPCRRTCHALSCRPLTGFGSHGATLARATRHPPPHHGPGQPAFLTKAMACAALSSRQSRSGAQRDVGHRASAATHAVGWTTSPFGSRPGARPRRRGPQPYSLIRFSGRSWRIERLGATQAVALVRNAGYAGVSVASKP